MYSFNGKRIQTGWVEFHSNEVVLRQKTLSKNFNRKYARGRGGISYKYRVNFEKCPRQGKRNTFLRFYSIPDFKQGKRNTFTGLWKYMNFIIFEQIRL